MKKSDIVIGQEYAQGRDRYSTPQRVKVLGEARISVGWSYQKKTVSGTRAQVLDRQTGKPATRPDGSEWIIEVANREILEPWVDYAERNAAMAKARRESDRRRLDARRERAGFLLDLVPALRHAGFLDTKTTVYDNETVKALREQVPDCIEFVEEGLRGWEFTAPLPQALAKYVENGASIPVPASELLRILDGRSVR